MWTCNAGAYKKNYESNPEFRIEFTEKNKGLYKVRPFEKL